MLSGSEVRNRRERRAWRKRMRDYGRWKQLINSWARTGPEIREELWKITMGFATTSRPWDKTESTTNYWSGDFLPSDV